MSNKLNLVFIMFDQLRYDAIHANGNDIIETPNIDSIIQNGTNFTSYYTNAPVSVPSRCTLFTGKYLHTHRVRENHTFLEAGREIHLFRILKQANYKIGYFGKNHLLQDEEFQNFDGTDVEDVDHIINANEQVYKEIGKTAHHKMNTIGCYAGPTYFDLPKEYASVYSYTSSACDFIEKQNKDEAFGMCLSILEPHAPHIAPKEFDKYKVENLPEFAVEELKEKAKRYYMKYLAQHGENATDEDKKKFIQMYYSMISFADEQVGRVLDKLKEKDLFDNSLIVFTSDHGEFLFEHGMCKKDLVLCESLLHAPFILSCPQKIEKNLRCNELVEEVDVLPTILDILEIKAPIGIQGKSVMPYLKGETKGHKDAVYSEICPPWLNNPFNSYEDLSDYWLNTIKADHVPFNVPGDYTKSVRTKDYRYVWYNTKEEELYDVKADPKELHNLAYKDEYKAIKAELKMNLLEWLALSEDPIDGKLFDILQYQYPNWTPAKKVSDKVQYGPYWVDYAGFKD